MSINLRTAASYIPFIGPQMAVFNYANLKKDLKSALASYEYQKRIANTKITRYQSDGYFIQFKNHVICNSWRFDDPQIRRMITDQITEQNEKIATANNHIKNIKISAFKKGRIYAASGLVGNVLTIAILISIIVATALSGVLVVDAAVSLSIMLAGSIGLSIYSGYELYTFNKNLKVLQAT